MDRVTVGSDAKTVILDFTGQWWNDGTRWAETLKLGAVDPPRHMSTTCRCVLRSSTMNIDNVFVFVFCLPGLLSSD